MTYRLIDTEIWADPWFEDLSAQEKLIFVYLFTNGSCNQAGVITQFSPRRAAFDTGLDREEVETAVAKFVEAGKVIVDGNMVACVSFVKHQARNGNFAISASRAIDALPEGNIKATLTAKKATWKQPQSNPEATRKQLGSNASTVQDRTVQDRVNTRNIARSAKPSRAVTLVDDSFLESLKENSAFDGIDIDREHGKMLAWLQTPRGRGKQPTRTRFLNWLNRCNPQDRREEPESYITCNTFEDEHGNLR